MLFTYTVWYIDHCVPGMFSTLTILPLSFVSYSTTGDRGSPWSAPCVVRNFDVFYPEKVTARITVVVFGMTVYFLSFIHKGFFLPILYSSFDRKLWFLKCQGEYTVSVMDEYGT